MNLTLFKATAVNKLPTLFVCNCTGNVKGSVVDAQYKANTLQKLAEEYHIPRKNTLAIGDGANDLAMMNVAGLGVAFHAKPKVQQQAQIVVNFADLTALLCLLSANDRI